MSLERSGPQSVYLEASMLAREQIRGSGLDIPQAIIHDPMSASFRRDLTVAFKKASGRRFVSPGGLFPNRTERRAREEGRYKDAYELFSRDSLALGQPKTHWFGREEELAQKIAEDDNPANYVVAEYNFLDRNRFNKIHRKDRLLEVLFSRRYGIHSEASMEAGRTKTVGIIGQGVGEAATLEMVRNGVENLITLDGGVIMPHDGNRHWGPLIPSVGENHAIYAAQQALLLNPYLNLDCIPLNASANTPGTYPTQDVVVRSDFMLDEVDSLLDKADLRFLAWQARKPVGQITDLGKGIAIQFDDPRTGKYPCNGRLTPDVYREMQRADLSNFEVFMHYAADIFIGHENITPEVEEAFRRSRERGYYHIPQSGIAASKAGAAAYELFEAYFEGKEIVPERVTGYDWAK